MAEFRIDRQCLDVLGTPATNVRVTKVCKLVLASPPPPPPEIRVTDFVALVLSGESGTKILRVQDDLSLTDEASAEFVHQAAEYDRDTASNLSLSDLASCVLVTAGGASVYTVAVEDSLGLTDSTGRFRAIALTAANDLALGDAPSTFDVRHISDNSLNLTETIGLLRVRGAQGSDDLGIQDHATHQRIVHRTVASSLNLGQTVVVVYPHYLSVADALSQAIYTYDPATDTLQQSWSGLQDAVRLNIDRAAPSGTVSRLAIGDHAEVVVLRATGISVSASDTLDLWDRATRNRPGTDTASLLTLTDTAQVAVQRKPIIDTLDLVEVVKCSIIRNLAAGDTLDLEESSVCWAVVESVLSLYHPFVGAGRAGLPPPPPATLAGPIAGIGPCRFVYPVVSPTESVALRSPEFGNKDRLQFNRISRETRGGTLIVFADAIWPKVETQVLTFSGLTQAQAQALQDFIAAHLGLEVGFVDWEQRYWKGVITNTTDAVVQDGREMYTASLEFECELTTWTP